ncbi:phage tail tube protein [Subtercola sp. RTI3]|uniref:phage tail tube protein n=1 Tax=Subtercola sp. RTI3 TaxID=3048639 RepID=UPI002B2375C8|nr:phage tail tube protein [Subtercola sp. RTI3]MEA9986255.1 phage tail tube protein [Subtercola sp. RTI3]
MGNPFIGRKDSVGVGIEAVPGTTVAPQAWQRHLALSLDPNTTVIQNTSAMGRVEEVNDSAVTEQWVDGTINGKVTSNTIGYFMLNMLGIVTPTLHSGETAVWDNLFTIDQGNVPPSLTFARSNPVIARRFGLGTQSDIEFSYKQNDWAQFTSTVMAKAGQTSSETVAFIANEPEFTSKHVTVKLAANVAGLSAASALQLKSLKFKISRKADRFTPMGAIDPVSFDNEDYSVTGSFVLRYTDHTLEDLGMLNTTQALSIDLTNSDVTIGTAAHPQLTFTMPQVRLAPISLDDPLKQALSQTINFSCELNSTLGYLIQGKLVNTQNGYAHA